MIEDNELNGWNEKKKKKGWTNNRWLEPMMVEVERSMSGANEPESDEWLGDFGLWEEGLLTCERKREGELHDREM